jgi:hypothetical protein
MSDNTGQWWPRSEIICQDQLVLGYAMPTKALNRRRELISNVDAVAVAVADIASFSSFITFFLFPYFFFSIINLLAIFGLFFSNQYPNDCSSFRFLSKVLIVFLSALRSSSA